MLMRIRTEVLDDICRHALETYPSECCGFLTAPDLEEPITDSIPCANAQDRLHGEDPVRYPRTSREAFYIDDAELFSVYRHIAEREYHIVGVYHSHIDVDAFFSDEDRRLAIVNGEPVWPEAHYVILSVSKSGMEHINCYHWNCEQSDFVEETIETEEARSL